MVGPEFRMSFSDLVAFEREISANIRYGRVFLREVVDAPVLSEGVLVIVHPLHGTELRLPAQIVMVNSDGPMRGTGIALRAFSANDVMQVESFARNLEPPASCVAGVHEHGHVDEHEHEHEHEHGCEERGTDPEGVMDRVVDDGELGAALESTRDTLVPGAASPTLVPGAVEESADESLKDDTPADEAPADDPGVAADSCTAAAASTAEPLQAAVPEMDPDAECAAEDLDASQDASEGDDAGLAFDEDALLGFDEDPGYDPAAIRHDTQASTRQERLRALNAVEQLKVARKGELADRIVVERLYGKQVWEALLQNPRITLPEIARIARKGSVPRPLLEIIWENGSWTRDASVRRALLGNPKLTADAILKLLKQTPKHELKVMEKTTAYSMAGRDIARKLLRE